MNKNMTGDALLRFWGREMSVKRRLAAIILLAVLLLTGCSYTQTGIDSMLKPPKLSEEQNKIYNALVSSVSKTVKLKYPRSGEFTSAFVVRDMDNEPTQEALVFYESSGSGGTTSVLSLIHI